MKRILATLFLVVALHLPSLVFASELNLIVNGDFEKHWSEGWSKQVSDPTAGNLLVEVNDRGLLHMVLTGKNVGQVYQKITLPSGKGLQGLVFEAGVKLIPKKGQRGLLAEPADAALILQLHDEAGNNIGQIWFASFDYGWERGLALPGARKPGAPTGKKCQEEIGREFHRVSVRLDEKVMDCLSEVDGSNVASIELGCVLITKGSTASVEAYLDDVKLYYQ